MKKLPQMFSMFFYVLLFQILTIFIVSATNFSVINPNPTGNGNTSSSMACSNDGGTNYVCYDTIQEAINNSSNGDTIYVQSGIYSENIVVDKEISLLCQSNAVLDGTGIANRDSAGITISANNVTINGCEITGYQKGIVTEDPYLNGGISFINITITNNIIHDLFHYNSPVPDARRSNGIEIGVESENFLPFYNPNWTGYVILDRYDYSGLLIENNTIYDTYAGIIIDGTFGSQIIRNNNIYNSTSTAITLNTANDVLVNSNNLHNNIGPGVYLCSQSTNNWDAAYDVLTNDPLSPTNITITNNNIYSNGTTDWGGGAYSLYEQKLNNGISVISAVSSTIFINNNLIYDNGRGVRQGAGVSNFTSDQINALNNDWLLGNTLNDLPRDIWGGDGSLYDTNPWANSGSDLAFGNLLYATSQINHEYNLDSCFGNTAVDSQSSHNGTLTNGPIWAEGKSYQGLHFDGVDDYIDVSNGGGINLGTSHTISAWVNFDNLSNPAQNVLFGETASPNAQYALWFRNEGDIYYRAGTDWARWQLSGADILTTGTWYHFVVTRNGTTVTLYINGVSKGDRTFTDNDDLVINYIGKENNTATTQYNFAGTMDEIKFYKGALSQTEVLALFNSYNTSTGVACHLDAPTFLGRNLRSISGLTNPGKTPVDISCGGITNGDYQIYGDGRTSSIWTSVFLHGYTVQYEKQWVYPGGDPTNPADWHGHEIWSTPYTDYRTFGSSAGTEGLWYNRVRAFVDYDNDGIADLVSDWSNPCSVTYDRTPPAKPTGLQRIAPNEGNKIYACGAYSQIQRMWPDWDDNTESDFDHYEYTSFNAPNGDIGIYRRVFYNSIFQYTGGWMPNEGTYGFAVRAVDTAGNVSDWALTDETLAGSCQITYDNTAPTSEIYIQGDLDETKDLPHNNGWHGYGWYESFDNINLRISTGDTTNDMIFYQILAGDMACPDYSIGYTQTSHDTNIANLVNGTDGIYTLCFYSQDLAGNLEATIHKELLHIDDTSPSYTITGANGILVTETGREIHYVNTDTIQINISVQDNLSGYTRARFDLYSADENWNCTHQYANEDNLLPPSTSTTRTLTETGLSDGRYCYRVWIYDDVQNKAWWDTNNEGWVYFVVDTTPPTADQLNDQEFQEGEVGSLSTARGYDTNQLTYTIEFQYFDPLNSITYPWTTIITNGTMSEVSPGIWERDLDPTDGHTDLMQDYLIDTSLYAIGSEGIYRMHYWVTDPAGNTSSVYDVTYTVNNVAPSVSLTPDQTIDEGETASFTGVFSDPSSFGTVFYDDTNWDISIDYGDGSGFVTISSTTSPGSITGLSHTYVHEGIYTVTLQVCEGSNDVDGDGLIDGEEQCSSANSTVIVNNLAPSVNLSANPGTNVEEGTVVILTAIGTGGNAPLTYAWSGACSGNNQTYNLPSTPGTYTCQVRVTDSDGDSATSSITVTVNSTASDDQTSSTTGTTNSTNNNESYTNQGEIDGDTDNFTKKDIKGEVLGLTCDKRIKLSGYVYIDKDDDNEFTEKDKSLKNTQINIYAYIDGQRELIISPITDEEGYWEVNLCPGNYELKIDKESLKSNLKVKGESIKKINISSDSQGENLNIALKEVSGFNWLLCLVPILVLIALSILLWLIQRRRDTKRVE